MAWVVGTGITAFGKQPERSLLSLAREACVAALADAGLRAEAIRQAYVANVLGGILFADTTQGQNIVDAAGITGIPVFNVENACASGTTAFHLAVMAIEAGQCEVALVVGAEKMCVPGLGLIHSGLSDLDTRLGMVAPASFALRARRYLHEFDATVEEFAAVTVKSRAAAAHNPLAQFRQPETVASVLASPMVADPLTRAQCCPIADGAAALVLHARPLDARAVQVRSSVISSGTYLPEADLVRWETDRRTARMAYEAAGVGPADLDVIECHDAFTIAEILHYEAFGLCPVGEGARLAASGATALGGRLPVNPSGGLLSRGHPVGATGVAQVVEVVTQLRQEAGKRQVPDCRMGLVHCMGGDKGGDTKSCTVSILSR